MRIKVKYIESEGTIKFERCGNLIVSEGAIDKIRRT